MPTYGARSLDIVAQLHPELQRWLGLVIKQLDHSVVEGPRSKEMQQHYYEAGLSKVTGDQAKHCRVPCEAVHLLPFPWDKAVPLDSRDGRERITLFAGAALMIAKIYGFPIRWGGDWNLNWETHDNTFDDLLHFELVTKPTGEDDAA
jgi:peptidoglycan L-alanyl-D-glutamate endopeptidase CwlK